MSGQTKTPSTLAREEGLKLRPFLDGKRILNQYNPTAPRPSITSIWRTAADMGWHLIRLYGPTHPVDDYCKVPGKQPVAKGWKTAANISQIEADMWLHNGGNLGIVCGTRSNNLLVVDCDGEGNRPEGLPDTPTVQTGGGGLHLYYFVPEGIDIPKANKCGHVAAGVDIRYTGGQVVAPGSVHPKTGAIYEWLPGLSPEEIPVAPVPDWIVRALLTPKEKPKLARVATTTPRGIGYQAAALRGAQDDLRNAPEGTRNYTLNKKAYHLASRGIAEGEIIAALEPVALEVGLDSGEIMPTIQSGISGGVNNPNPLPPRPSIDSVRPNSDEQEPTVNLPEVSRPDVDPFGELANAYRFKKLVDGRIMSDPRRGWVVDKDGYWQSGEREAIKEASKIGAIIRREGHAATTDPDIIRSYYAAARRAESARGVESTLKLARALPGVDATGIKWDADEWLVNVKNGTVDVRTLTLMPHDRSDYLTRRIPFDYDPEAPCPLWTAHLNKVFAGKKKMVEYLQFHFGYSITASMRHQTFVIIHGKAGTGKSTTIESAMYVMGDYADAVSHDVVLDQQHSGHACTLAALCGLRFGLVSELPEGAKWNEAQVKRLATGDTLSARLIGQNPFSFKSTMKIWANCNERPDFRDAGGGMARRIRCIPFEVDMTGDDRDRDIEAKLRAEAPGILRWILEGARVAFEGEPEIPEEVRISSSEYIKSNDLLGKFIDECCILDPRGESPTDATFEAFKAWDGWDHKVGKNKLGKLLLSRFDQYSDGKKRYWIGFKLSA